MNFEGDQSIEDNASHFRRPSALSRDASKFEPATLRARLGSQLIIMHPGRGAADDMEAAEVRSRRGKPATMFQNEGFSRGGR
jgi:hypothetical protein